MSSKSRQRARASGQSSVQAACEAVRDRARRDLPEAAYRLWFAELIPGRIKGQVVELVAPTSYVRSWLAGHYMDLITVAVEEALGRAIKVRVKTAEAANRAAEGPRPTVLSATV